jgi:hypothetical protein
MFGHKKQKQAEVKPLEVEILSQDEAGLLTSEQDDAAKEAYELLVKKAPDPEVLYNMIIRIMSVSINNYGGLTPDDKQRIIDAAFEAIRKNTIGD